MPQLINSNENVFLDYEMSVRIQNIYYNLLIQALQKHCKVFVLRMDVHIPQELVLQTISAFNHRFIEKEKIAGYDPLYIVAREISFGKRIHHHMALFLDGNRTNNFFNFGTFQINDQQALFQMGALNRHSFC